MICTLLATNPPHAGNLVDGIKTIEWRKKPLPKGRTLIYETQNRGGCAMVIGEVEVVGHEQVQAHRIRDWAVTAGCVSRHYIQAYAKGKELYANFVINAKRYEEPIPLSRFYKAGACRHCLFQTFRDDDTCHRIKVCNYGKEPLKHPPISWCYVEEVERCTG